MNDALRVKKREVLHTSPRMLLGLAALPFLYFITFALASGAD